MEPGEDPPARFAPRGSSRVRTGTAPGAVGEQTQAVEADEAGGALVAGDAQRQGAGAAEQIHHGGDDGQFITYDDVGGLQGEAGVGDGQCGGVVDAVADDREALLFRSSCVGDADFDGETGGGTRGPSVTRTGAGPVCDPEQADRVPVEDDYHCRVVCPARSSSAAG